MKPVASDGKRLAHTGAEIAGKRRENNSEAPAENEAGRQEGDPGGSRPRGVLQPCSGGPNA